MYEATPFAKKDLTKTGGARVSPERKQWVRKESAIILAKNMLARDKAKQDIVNKRRERDLISGAIKEERLQVWERKTRSSPFAVDLVAESERIIEENQIRADEEEEMRRRILNRRNKAKNDIILKALSEFSDLEVLRREKRAILEEEQRLKALLAIEKTSGDRKAHRLAAVNAQRQRQAAKTASRRLLYKESLEAVMREESAALMKKSGLVDSSSSSEFRT
jgi:hypothetical protein